MARRDGPPTDEERARWEKFNERLSCQPCLHGEHFACRHHPTMAASGYGRAPDGDTRPCACERENHERVAGLCTDYRTNDWGSGKYCSRPAKGTFLTRSVYGPYEPGAGRGQIEKERCGIHLAGLRRQAQNDAKLRADLAASRERWSTEEANRRASSDWVERLAEFGVPARSIGGQVLSVMVDPERLYGMIHEAVVEMDHAGIEHRFQPLPEPEADTTWT